MFVVVKLLVLAYILVTSGFVAAIAAVVVNWAWELFVIQVNLRTLEKKTAEIQLQHIKKYNNNRG